MNNLENQNMENKQENTPKLATYEIPTSLKLESLLSLVDAQKAEIDNFRPLDESLLHTIQEKLKFQWTCSSNAIEGSTLTLGETIFFLQHGITAEGKSFKDYLDAKNHSEAIDFVFDLVTQERPLSIGVIKEINALLLNGVKYTPAIDQFGNPAKKKATPGAFKNAPNHVLQPDGSIQYYVAPLQVEAEMETLINWMLEKTNNGTHPLITAALGHYNMVRIHPFDDGNGRGARLLMNLILIQKGFPPAILKDEERRKYIDSITKADRGDASEFVEYIAQSLFQTQESILEDLKKSPQ